MTDMTENKRILSLTEPFLTCKETANKLRVSMATLSSFRRKKTGPRYLRIGRQYLYPEKDLIEYINNLIVEDQ